MPDTFAPYVAPNTAALAQIGAAAVALSRSLDCDRHLMARTFVDDASALLENAASFCPERRDALLTLAGRLEDACDCIGHPCGEIVEAVRHEVEGIERELGDGES